MDTTFSENGKEYKIVAGRVVEASATPEPQEEAVELKIKDRVVVGKKLGTVEGFMPTVYGKTAAVKLDDGTVSELLVENLERAPVDKTAAVVSADNFESEYESYMAMPTDTTEEIVVKADKARELNLRAKALQTNSKNALADQILYDRVITATYVDVKDLRDAAQRSAAAEENYLENLPKYEISEGIYRGGMSRGDASWLGHESSQLEPVEVDEGALASRATLMVASYNREQLEDDDFMKAALQYALETTPEEAKPKFASMVREARTQKLENAESNQRTASVSEKDLDGNAINLDDVPLEAIFGV